MVKRRKKSGRREATAPPMEPARRFALRSATADCRLRALERTPTALGAARTARVEGPGVQRIRRIIAEMPARSEVDPLAGFVPLRRGVSAGSIAARANLTPRRSRSEIAPQRLEKIESRLGNCMASDASKPQDVVDERALILRSG
jgi:hypothetical protein